MNGRKAAIIILAAGASSRFGSPKQLAKIGNDHLLERIYKTAILTEMKVLVVLGANAKVILDACDLGHAEIVFNDDWEVGMSSSIVAGLERTLDIYTETEAVLIVLCDQPFVTEKTLLKLIAAQRKSGKPIVASEYSDTIGTPALFMKEVFSELLKLKGERGAKALIEKYRPEDLALVPLPEAAPDIDSKDDLEKINENPHAALF
ncbi:MAG: nucleotidyltransferase family protein [Pyrinomonadaceae bacterium]